MGVQTRLPHRQKAISERGSQGSSNNELSLSSRSKVFPPLRLRGKGRERGRGRGKTASLLPYLHLVLNLEIGRSAPRARRVRGGIGQALLVFGGESPKRVLCPPMWYPHVFRHTYGVHPMICAGTEHNRLVFTPFPAPTLHPCCYVR